MTANITGCKATFSYKIRYYKVSFAHFKGPMWHIYFKKTHHYAHILPLTVNVWSPTWYIFHVWTRSSICAFKSISRQHPPLSRTRTQQLSIREIQPSFLHNIFLQIHHSIT